MKKLLLVFLVFMTCHAAQSQSYYLSDDSLSVIIKIKFSNQDSLEAIDIQLMNGSKSWIFFCRQSSRKYLVYVSTYLFSYSDTPAIFQIGTRCDFGLDPYTKSDHVFMQMAPGDTLRLSMKEPDLPRRRSGRRYTRRELEISNKSFAFEYALVKELGLPVFSLQPMFDKNKKLLCASMWNDKN